VNNWMNPKEIAGHSTNVDITSRLQKGGALLSDMRLIVAAWSDEMADKDPIPHLARALPKTTTARVRDTFTRAFRPRFLSGSPPGAWRLARVLEDLEADLQVIREFYYWITARAEAPLYGFATEVIYSLSRSPNREVRIEEAVAWLSSHVRAAGKRWTPTVTKKVARGMLAALRDFGILEGTVRKRIASVSLPPEVFAMIAFCLQDMGITGRQLVKHLDWRLFLLGETGVEHLFLECHQQGWLRFESAGKLARIEFPEVIFMEYAHGILA
jgi:hypothetical protein